jgi:uncharacterized protein (UPF0218 family)
MKIQGEWTNKGWRGKFGKGKKWVRSKENQARNEKTKTSFSVNKTYRNKFKNRAPAISFQLKACIWYGCHDNKIHRIIVKGSCDCVM